MAIWCKKKSLSLVRYLFLSHALVTIVGVISLVLVNRVYSHHSFLIRIEQLEQQGYRLDRDRNFFLTTLSDAWNHGDIEAAIAGIITGVSLSYWIVRKITQSVKKIERVTENFARGNLEERLPILEISELNRLSASFNNMATNLQRIEQRRQELIEDITHELRTPLTIIHLYLEGINSEHIEPDRKTYQLLMSQAKKLKKSIDDFQLLSRVETGHLSIHLHPIDIYSLLSSAIAKFSEQLFDDSVIISLDCQSSLPQVLADSDRLEEVVFNLVGNALAHTERGSINISVWTKERQMWVAVSDTGVGIAPEDLPFVFDRFWQSGSARQRNEISSGIGLVISRRAIELLGGKIEVESNLGKGTTFRFCLPLA